MPLPGLRARLTSSDHFADYVVLAQLTLIFSVAQAPSLDLSRRLFIQGDLMKPNSIITFGLASLLTSSISAQTPTADGAAAQKSSRLPPIKVEAPHAAAKHNRRQRAHPWVRGE